MLNDEIRFLILGSGTSSGVPTISCQCSTCSSIDPKDKRLRTSLLVQSHQVSVVIDTTPDFRQQMLMYNINKIDGIVFTHGHFDHIGGLDDIRAYNYTTKQPVDIYLNKPTFERIRKVFYYIFEKQEQIGGGIPLLNINFIDSEPFRIGDLDFIPLKLLHGKMEVLGFRISNFAYCTDTNFIPDETMHKLEDVEVLVLDALRYDKHSTHFNLNEAIEVAKKINAKRTYFIHIAHQIKHSDCQKALPEGMFLAYDGMEIILKKQ